jgi:hypothetical protein
MLMYYLNILLVRLSNDGENMVEELPLRLFGDTPRRYKKLLGRDMPHTYDDVHSLRQEFIDADTKERMNTFLEKHELYDVYGLLTDYDGSGTQSNYYTQNEIILNDMSAMRTVLITTLNVKALIDNDAATLDSLKECGIEFKIIEIETNEWADDYELLQSYEKTDVFSYDFDFILSYCDAEFGEKFVVTGWYFDWLYTTSPEWGELYTDWGYDGVHFQLPSEVIHEEHGIIPVEKCAAIVAQAFVDSAISAHLGACYMVSVNSQMVIELDDFVQTIWYSLFESFRGGRVGRCLVCGKPYVSKMERGERRKYCSARCTKRASRAGFAEKRPGHKRSYMPSDTPKA